MSKTRAFAGQILALILNAVAIANVADDAGSTPLTALYLSLHSGDPGETGDQTTNEVSWGSYARKAVLRQSTGSKWTVTNNEAVNAEEVLFDDPTSGSGNVTHIGIGDAASGTGVLRYSSPIGTITPLGLFTAEADTDVVTVKGHGLSVDDRVSFYSVAGVALPTGLTQGTVYYVKTAPDADTMTLSATSGGATINFTTDGSGLALAGVPLPVTSTPVVTPKFPAGSIKFIED